MAQLEKLETKLDDVLNKKAPKLPESNRKTLAGALWWLALIAGVAQLYVAWHLWDTWHKVDEVANYINAYASAYGVGSTADGLGMSFYLSIATLVVSGALLLLAAPALKAMKKAGWNLVFYSLLVNLVAGVVALFTEYGDLGDLFGAVVGSAVGGYLLFQVRAHFTKHSAVAHKA